MHASDIFGAAGGYGAGAVALAVCALITSVVLAIAKGMGNWVPAPLWLTTPALVLTVGAFGAAESGQLAVLELGQSAPSDQLAIAVEAWPNVTSGLAVARICTGVALLLVAGAVLIGHLVGRLQAERNTERERQWVCARVLLGTTLLSGIGFVIGGVALWRDVVEGARLGGMVPAGLDPLRLGGLATVGLGAALTFAVVVPSWRRLIERRSLVGAGLCLLLLAGGAGAEAVAGVQKYRLEQAAEAPTIELFDAEETPPSTAP